MLRAVLQNTNYFTENKHMASRFCEKQKNKIK